MHEELLSCVENLFELLWEGMYQKPALYQAYREKDSKVKILAPYFMIDLYVELASVKMMQYIPSDAEIRFRGIPIEPNYENSMVLFHPRSAMDDGFKMEIVLLDPELVHYDDPRIIQKVFDLNKYYIYK